MAGSVLDTFYILFKSDAKEVEDGTKVVPGTNMIITTLDKLVNWGRQGSIWPMTFGLA